MSLHNDLYSRMVIGQPEPEVGMGCSILSYSDRHAASVSAVLKPDLIEVRRDHAKRVDGNGFSESQEYEFSPNSEGARSYFKRSKEGFWREVYRNPESGRWVLSGGVKLRLGQRLHYHDFSF